MFGLKQNVFRNFGQKFSAVANLGFKMIPGNRQQIQQMRNPVKRKRIFMIHKEPIKYLMLLEHLAALLGWLLL